MLVTCFSFILPLDLLFILRLLRSASAASKTAAKEGEAGWWGVEVERAEGSRGRVDHPTIPSHSSLFTVGTTIAHTKSRS